MKPTVYMMLGLPGSGKTTFSKQLEKKLGVRRFSIDEECAKLGADLKQEYWDFEISKKAGMIIRKETEKLVAKRESVILDLCPWIKEKREEYRAFIQSIGANCHIYYFKVEKEELLKRLSDRNLSSDKNQQFVTPQMLDDFIEEFDEPEGEGVEIVHHNLK